MNAMAQAESEGRARLVKAVMQPNLRFALFSLVTCKFEAFNLRGIEALDKLDDLYGYGAEGLVELCASQSDAEFSTAKPINYGGESMWFGFRWGVAVDLVETLYGANMANAAKLMGSMAFPGE